MQADLRYSNAGILNHRGAASPLPGEADVIRDVPKRMRILMVADVDPCLPCSGAERVLNEQSRRLAARGHRVVVLTRRSDPGLWAEEDLQGVRVVRHAVTGKGEPALLRSVLTHGAAAATRLQMEEKFDLVNLFQPLSGTAALRDPAISRLPIVYTFFSPWGDEYRHRQLETAGVEVTRNRAARAAWVELNTQVRTQVERRLLRRVDQITVLSKFSQSQLREVHGIQDDRVTVIPAGVDSSRFSPSTDRARLRAELRLPDSPILLTIRGLEPRMGLSNLVQAMGEVVKVRPDCRLLIGGSGPLRKHLQEQVTAAGLTQSIEFLGFVTEEALPAYFAAADLFILPTNYLEGFGLVTLEAMATGTPVLGTPVGGTQEILEGFDSRFLFDGTSPTEMAQGILSQLPQIASDDELREKCRCFTRENYSWETIIPKLETLFRQTLAQRASTG